MSKESWRLCQRVVKIIEKYGINVLSDESKNVIKKLLPYLKNGRTGRYRKNIKNFKNLISFVFISLSYPIGANNLDDNLEKIFKNKVESFLNDIFGNNGKYGISFHMGSHHTTNDHRQKSFHIHIALSRLLFDKKQIKDSFPHFDKFDEQIKPIESLYFCKNVITLNNLEITKIIIEKWSELIFPYTGFSKRKFDSVSSDLVYTSGHSFQNPDDCGSAENYINNEAMRAFKNIANMWEQDNKVFVLKKDGNVFSLDYEDFCVQYLVRPNYHIISGIRWSPFGGLCGTSKFCKILKYVSLVKIYGKYIYEYSPEEILGLANEREKLYGDARMVGKTLKQKIFKAMCKKPALAINNSNIDWEKIVRTNIPAFEHHILFTFSKIITNYDIDVGKMLADHFGGKNVFVVSDTTNREKYDLILIPNRFFRYSA